MSVSRRAFLKWSVAGAAMLATRNRAFAQAPATTPLTKEAAMAFTLPPLPYDKTALEPFMSAKTFDFHYGKHHQAYVTKLNELVAGSEFEKMKLEDIILKTAGNTDKAAIFNNAAQIWNHTF